MLFQLDLLILLDRIIFYFPMNMQLFLEFMALMEDNIAVLDIFLNNQVLI